MIVQSLSSPQRGEEGSPPNREAGRYTSDNPLYLSVSLCVKAALLYL